MMTQSDSVQYLMSRENSANEKIPVFGMSNLRYRKSHVSSYLKQILIQVESIKRLSV